MFGGRAARSALAVVAGLCACALGGCGAAERPQIAFITSGGDPAFDRVVACAARAEARRRGAELVVRAPARGTTDAQLETLAEVAGEEPDVVVIQREDPIATMGAIERVAASGPHVVVVGGPPLDHPGEGVTAVSMSYFAAGVDAAHAAEPLSGVRHPYRKTPWVGHIATIGGGREAKVSRLLIRGFNSGHETVPVKHVRNFGSKLLGEDDQHIWASTGPSILGPPPLTVLVATEIRLAGPASRRVREDTPPGQVTTLTFGGGTRAIDALRADVLQALYVEDPRELGTAATRQALASLDGTAARRTAIRGTLVTRDEAEPGGRLSRLLDAEPC